MKLGTTVSSAASISYPAEYFVFLTGKFIPLSSHPFAISNLLLFPFKYHPFLCHFFIAHYIIFNFFVKDFIYYSNDNVIIAAIINPINTYCLLFNFSFKKILDNIIVTILYAAMYGEASAASPNANA